MARPKKYNISLTDDELNKLKSVMRKKQTTKTVRNRYQIIIDLDTAHGKVLTHEQSAKTNCVCMATITNTVKLYSEKGIEGIIWRNSASNKGLSDGLERTGGEQRGFHGAVDGAASEREPIGRLSSREVHRIHRWGRTFDGDGYRLHAENTGLHQVFWGWDIVGGVPGWNGD